MVFHRVNPVFVEFLEIIHILSTTKAICAGRAEDPNLYFFALNLYTRVTYE